MKEDGENAPEVDFVMSKPPHLQELNKLLIQFTARQN
jgi:hypothetical protein